MYQLMIITADTNDADYITSETEVSEEDVNFINSIIPKLITDSYNWKTQDIGSPYDMYKGILTEEEIDRFGDYLPSSEYGIHTIESIKIYDVISHTSLL